MIKLETTVAYTVEEIGELLNRTPITVRHYIQIGALKAKKVGNRYYITGRALEEFISGEVIR